MNTFELPFTYAYSQPQEYRFSLDSIHFIEFIADRLRLEQNLASIRTLDLCAGCGILGLQLSWFLRQLRHIDFVEVQDIYTPYFQQNITTVNRPELQLRWLLFNYDRLLLPEWQNKYDLIISNPPYFQAGHGVQSPSIFKNRCRFFLDSSYENFILAMANTLNVHGQAFFLQRPLIQHGYDLISDAQTLLKDMPLSLKKIAEIRGTDIIQIIKHEAL